MLHVRLKLSGSYECVPVASQGPTTSLAEAEFDLLGFEDGAVFEEGGDIEASLHALSVRCGCFPNSVVSTDPGTRCTEGRGSGT